MSTKRQAQLKAAAEGVEFVDETLNQPKKPASGHYVKNSELLAELKKSKEQGELTTEAVLMFKQIAERLSVKLRYNNPADREDCISSAVMDCIRYWQNFNPDVSENAFAYITSVCKNGYAKAWRQLGKMKFPDSMCVPITDEIYSI